MVHKLVDPESIAPGDVMTYTVVMMNDMLGGTDPGASVLLTDTIPAHTSYISGTLTGGATYEATLNRIIWSGSVPQGLSASISFQVQVDGGAPSGKSVENVALIQDALGRVYSARAVVMVGGL